MAIDNYNPIVINPGECLDNDGLQDIFDSISALYADSRDNLTKVTCQQFNEVINIESNGPEQCITLNTNSSNITSPEALARSGKKMLLWKVNINFLSFNALSSDDGFQPPRPTIEYESDYRITCNGSPIPDSSQSGISSAVFECPANSIVEFCASASSVNVSNGQLYGATAVVQVCAALICFDPVDIGRDLYIPCEIYRDCCYGSDGLNLVKQNLNSLCDIYRFGAQKKDRYDYDYFDLDSHDLVTFSEPTTWVAVGSIKFCITNTASINAGESVIFTLEANIGCPGQQVSCQNIYAIGFGETRCFTERVIACGVCQPGEVLAVANNESVECNILPPDGLITGGQYEITEAFQEYCITTYSDFGSDLSPITSSVVCLQDDVAEEITEKAADINQVACDRAQFSCGSDVICGSGNIGDDYTIKFGSTDPLATGNSTRYITGTITFCATANDSNVNYIRAVVGYDIKCGGTPYYTSPTNLGFTHINGQQLINRCFEYEFAHCITCDVKDDIIICPTSPETNYTIQWNSCSNVINI